MKNNKKNSIVPCSPTKKTVKNTHKIPGKQHPLRQAQAAVIQGVLPAEFASQFQGVQVQVRELQLLHRGRPKGPMGHGESHGIFIATLVEHVWRYDVDLLYIYMYMYIYICIDVYIYIVIYIYIMYDI